LPQRQGVEIGFAHCAVIQAGHGEDDADIHVGKRLLDGIASLQNGDVGSKLLVEQGVPLGAEPHVRDGVGVVIVLPRRIDHDLRLKFPEDRKDDVVQHVEKSFVGRPRREGDVDRRPQRVGTAEFVAESGSRIKRASVLVDGDAQGVRIVPVDVLRPVTVVAVRVDDGDLPHAVLRPDVLDHDRFDVDVAEAAGPMHDEHGVVSRRPHECEGVVDFLLHHLVRRRDRPARGDPVRLGGDAGRIGNADMGAIDLRVARQAGFILDDVVEVEEPLFEDLVLRIEEPLFPLRVGRRYGPVEGGKEDQAGLAFPLVHATFLPSVR